jgi:hypothetical protein
MASQLSIRFSPIKFPKNPFSGSYMYACGQMDRAGLIGALQLYEHT